MIYYTPKNLNIQALPSGLGFWGCRVSAESGTMQSAKPMQPDPYTAKSPRLHLSPDLC